MKQFWRIGFREIPSRLEMGTWVMSPHFGVLSESLVGARWRLSDEEKASVGLIACHLAFY